MPFGEPSHGFLPVVRQETEPIRISYSKCLKVSQYMHQARQFWRATSRIRLRPANVVHIKVLLLLWAVLPHRVQPGVVSLPRVGAFLRQTGCMGPPWNASEAANTTAWPAQNSEVSKWCKGPTCARSLQMQVLELDGLSLFGFRHIASVFATAGQS